MGDLVASWVPHGWVLACAVAFHQCRYEAQRLHHLVRTDQITPGELHKVDALLRGRYALVAPRTMGALESLLVGTGIFGVVMTVWYWLSTDWRHAAGLVAGHYLGGMLLSPLIPDNPRIWMAAAVLTWPTAGAYLVAVWLVP